MCRIRKYTTICIFILLLTTGPVVVITVKNMFKISTVAGKNNKLNLFIRDVQLHKPVIGLKRSNIHGQKAEVKLNLARDFRITNANVYFIETPGVVYLLFASVLRTNIFQIKMNKSKETDICYKIFIFQIEFSPIKHRLLKKSCVCCFCFDHNSRPL